MPQARMFMAVKIVQGLTPSAQPVGRGSAAYSAVAVGAQVSAAAQIATHHYAQAEAAVPKIRAHSVERKRQRITTEAEAFSLVEQLTLNLLCEEEGAREAHYQLSHGAAREHLT